MKIFLLLISILLIPGFGFAQHEVETTVRILSFNILHGATTNGDFDLDKLAAVIQKENPDLVALQEVDFKTNRAKRYDLATELGWRTSMIPLFGKAMNFNGGAYGVGILCRNPIITSRNFPLPATEGNEPRTSLEVLIAINGDTIRFVATHLDHKKESMDRILQVKAINDEFVKTDYPTILAGDLNATPFSKSITILKKYWSDSVGDKPEPSYPSDNPVKKIDYILFRPAEKWEAVENRTICDEVASDHCAVFSVLKLLK